MNVPLEEILLNIISRNPRKELTGIGVASLSLRGVGPHACAGVLIEMQTLGALDLDRLTLDAVVEDVADGCVGMGEEAVLAWTQSGALGFLCTNHTIKILEKKKQFRKLTYATPHGPRSQR